MASHTFRVFCRACRRYEYTSEAMKTLICKFCGSKDLRRDRIPLSHRTRSGCRSCGRRR